MSTSPPKPATGPVIKEYLNSLRLELDEQYLIDRIILADGFWELNVTLYVEMIIKSGWTCIDIGANAGYVTLPMAKRAGLSGKVLAFEPNPRMREKLLRNLELNPDNLASIELLPFGLGAEPGTYRLSEDLGFGFGNATISKVSDFEQGDIEVRTLDSFCLQEVNFIKIDVEGMEFSVLQGAYDTIRRCKPIILFETLTNVKPEVHKLSEDFLRELGYICYNIDFAGDELVEVGYPHYPQEDTLALPKGTLGP